MAGVHFKVTGDASGYVAATRQAEAATGKMVGSVTEEAKKIDNIFKTLAASAAAVFTFQTASDFAKKVAQVRGEFQQLEVAFETMLQSKEKADALMAQVVDTAAKTPFDLQGVANGAKQLLAYGVASEEVNDTLIRLGDIAAGLSIPLNDLVYLYGTTMTQGRLFTQDLRQFQGRGIPLADELAKQFGVTKDAVGELVTAGKVGFPEVQKAILAMTDEGGKFNNLMAKQSQTISGQISNLEDAVDQMFNEIGKSSEGAISGAIGMASSLVENYEKVGKIIGGIVTAFGSYKAALIAINTYKKAAIALEAAHAVAQRTSAVTGKKLTTVTLLFAKAQKALNAALLANPYVLVAAAVAALGVAIYANVTAKSAEEKAYENVNRQLQAYQENLEKQKGQLQELYGTINSAESTDLQKVIAMEQLRKLYPNIFKDLSDEEMLKLSAAEATKKLADQEQELYKRRLLNQIDKKTQEYEYLLKAPIKGDDLDTVRELKKIDTVKKEIDLLYMQYKELSDQETKSAFLALPAEQKIISLKESNAQLDAEIAAFDKKLKELRDNKKLAYIARPQEFGLGNTGGFLWQGATEASLLTAIQDRQQQKALNDKDIAENQAKVDANNKALSEKQKKANYDRQQAQKKAKKEFEDLTRNLNYRVAQADIDSMEEGYAKTIKQLELNLQKENDAIDRQKKDLLQKKYNNELQQWLAEDPEGRKVYDFKYVATLTADEKKLFEEMGEFAQQQFSKGFQDAGKKWENEARFFLKQFEIDAMSDGAKRDKAQRELDNEKELHALELQRRAYIEAARAAHLLAVAKEEAQEEFDENAANEDFNKIKENTTKRQKKDQEQAEQEALQNYYIEYGTYKEKVLYLTKQYAEKISNAATEGEKKSLEAERDKILKQLEQGQNKAYQNIFKDPAKMSLSSVSSAIKLAKDEIKKLTSKGVLNDDDANNLKILQEALEKLQSFSDSAPFAGFGDGLDGVVSKFNQILSIQKRINDARGSGNEEAKAEAEEELSAQKSLLKKNLAGVGVETFANGLTQAADAMRQIADISGDPDLQNTADILNGSANVISSAATGAAAGGWISALVGGLTSILGEVTGAITDAIAANKINEKALEDYAHQTKLIALTINKDVYDTIFGESVWAKIDETALKYRNAAAAFRELNKAAAERLEWTDIENDPITGEIIGATWEHYKVPLGDANIAAKGVGKKKKKYTGTLSSIFPELFDENGYLKKDKIEEAKTALATLQGMKLKDDEGVKLLEQAIDYAEKEKAALEELKSISKDYFGSIGQSFGDAIVDGILKGEDALKNFGDVAGSVVEQIARDFATSWMIDQYLNTFEDEMVTAMASGNQGEAMVGVIDNIVAGLPGVLESATYATKQILDMTKGTDYDLYEKYAEERSSSAKGTVQASQDSVDEVLGIATNIQSHTFSINERVGSILNISAQMLERLNGIESNTNRLAAMEDYLLSISGDMSSLWSKVRGSL